MRNNQLMYNSVVLGLVRIFSAYGWEGKELQHLSDKARYIEEGINKGDAFAYYTHLALLIQARKKDHKWGLLHPDYVWGIKKTLEICGNQFGWFSKEPLEKIKTKYSHRTSGNLFKNTEQGREALKRLRVYDKTNISYHFVEEYGIDTIIEQLRASGFPEGNAYISMEGFVPDILWEDHRIGINNEIKVRLYAALMPIVIITKK